MNFELANNFNKVITDIRCHLVSENPVSIAEELNNLFDPSVSQIYITLFQEELKPLRWGSKRKNIQDTILRIAFKLKENIRYSEFSVHDPKKCRIMFEMVTKEYPCNIRNLTTQRVSKNRFEPGVNGLKYIYKDIPRYFMPTDAVTRSIMSVNQLLNYLSKQTGIAKKTNKISERVHLMRREPIEYTFIESMAYISFEENSLPLYRGYPVPVSFSKEAVFDSMLKSMDWIIENMNEDGSFLYFYDGSSDTKVDLDHPKMVSPLYNNILRHSGGTITLLRGYELTKDQKYLDSAKKSIAFFLTTFREHTYKESYACYPFFNSKSKLGGAGIGLVALMHYYMHTGDECYRKQIDGLVRHLLSRVDEEGEMLGYYIHPKFNNGQAILDPSDDVKKELFSFYYPGEALLGLALYYRHIINIDEELQIEIYNKSQKALNFLVDVRPEKYDYMFAPLPADAWLMQAIEEWVKVEGFKQQNYIDFVFNDTQAMFDHMYTEVNAIAPDYVGGFFYNYGDHVYHDASRNEGVIAAYYLAKYLGDEHRANYIMMNMLKSAKGLMRTFHTPESTYAHKYPEKSINSFRFKLTRQWVRVDSVQHAACFFARLHSVMLDKQYLPENKVPLKIVNPPNKGALPEEIDGYKVNKVLGTGGFSIVYLVDGKENDTKQYALKYFLPEKHENLNDYEMEKTILELLNKYEHAIKFYHCKKEHDLKYFLLDYIDGGDLKSYIKTHGALDEKNAIIMLQDILGELVYINEQNILHNDVKPNNILIKDNRYYLIDWGLAKKGPHIKTVNLKGGKIYLPPDIYFGKRTSASEIYSLGCALYFSVVGKEIFGLKNKLTIIEYIYAHIYSIPDFPDHVSSKMKFLITRMIEKNPEKRATIQEIHAIVQNEVEIKHDIPEPKRIKPSGNEYKDFLTAAEDGVVYAQNEVGKILSKGEIVKKDMDRAIFWYEKASLQGYAAAQCNFALCYFNGTGLQKDIKKTCYWLELSANQGYAKAQYLLGKLFYEGSQVKEDYQQADYWFNLAARNAYSKANKYLEKLNA